MVSLLAARKNVPLVVKSVSVDETCMGGRGRRRRGRNLCRRFSNMGIREGVVVRKISAHPFFGPIVIKVGNSEVAVGRGMAGAILVEEAEE